MGRLQKTKTIKKAKKDKRKFVLTKLDFLFQKYSLRHNEMTSTFKLIMRILADKDSEKPIMGHNSFINNPKNMRNAMLNPADSKIISATLSFSNLKNLKTIIPGTKVR
jgi:hypothetical protein